ncbi:serine/threonine protein kinase with WD40 repeats [Crinalium epipsammum PCC 9333]|uniref:Serine/threonine protein kinase with WD40 repeats n=1 Tax=Crinalium epipsammum PCC 9333 TaxID=1173022 RepID=K9W2X9_9CYAN|nr:serine/threonine-protein kinase [Crinalium epipsammum]AFZ13790.1 serine/threonine protein kinase with WD40 repeats [Crinalium epipsammum PCC 9333]
MTTHHLAMQVCINFSCPKPTDPLNANNPICRHCGSELVLQNRYRVVRLLSDQSGFGNVYEVDDGGRSKILKVLKQHHNTNPTALKLFQKEATALSQLDHPGIPKFDNYFQLQLRNSSGGANSPLLHCIVMEKIDGSTLEEWQNQRGNKPISQEQAIIWLKQVVEILKTIHNHSYFHRDIKPSNIMLRPNGELVLIDFGSTREMTYTYLGKVSGAGNITKLTSAGYTPPEQDKGHAVPQSDFYALGRTFVYLLTGKEPNHQAIYNPYKDELVWRGHARGLSPHFADLIDDMMAHQAGNRPKNAQEILQRLNNISKNIHPPPPPPQQLKRYWILSGVLAILITIIGSAQAYSQSAFNSDVFTLLTSLTLLEKDNFNISDLSEGSSLKSVTFNSKGEILASTTQTNIIKIWNLSLSERLTTLNDQRKEIRYVTFSRDGNTLASASNDNTIKIWDIATAQDIGTFKDESEKYISSLAISQNSQTLANVTWGKNITIWNMINHEKIGNIQVESDSFIAIAISPDGQILASGTNDEIKLWNIANREEKQTFTVDSGGITALAFSPDGKILASGSNDNTIQIWNLITGKIIRTLAGHSSPIRSMAFSPNGQKLVSSSDDNTIKIWRLQKVVR